MEKEAVILWGQEIGQRYRLNAHETKTVEDDPTCHQNIAVRELLYNYKDNGELEYTEWFGIFYKGASKLIEKTLAQNGFETTVIYPDQF